MQTVRTRRRVLVLVVLAALILLGAVMRIAACWKGYPELQGADESIVVNQAIKLLESHSLQVDFYDWPAHLLIKACAVIFEVYSQLRFGQSAVEIYALNPASFYVLARGFTALLGTLMIPLAWWICENVKKGAGLWGAALFTFFSVYVEHSGYDTTDVPLAFFTLLTIALAIRYLDKATWGRLAALCICVGAGISVKYTGALACLLIAVVVCIQAWNTRSVKLFFLGGMFSVAVVLFAFFVLAPNLVINWQRTFWQLGVEARGDYGLTAFLTKLRDYLLTWINAGPGVEGILLAAAGTVWLIRRWKIRYLPLFLGFAYWLALSAMGMWWVRWGTPFYTAPLLLAAVGLSACTDLVHAALADKARGLKALAKPVLAGLLGLVVLAGTVSTGLLAFARCLAPQTILVSADWCRENGVAESDCLYNGYTAFAVNWAAELGCSVDEAGNLVTPEGKENAQYALISTLYKRFVDNPDLPDAAAGYQYIFDNWTLIHTIEEWAPSSSFACVNTGYSLARIAWLARGGVAGDPIRIYQRA